MTSLALSRSASFKICICSGDIDQIEEVSKVIALDLM